MNTTRQVIYIVSALIVVFFIGFIPPTCQKQSLEKEHSKLQDKYSKLENKYQNMEDKRKLLSEMNNVGKKFIKSYEAAKKKNFGSAKDIAKKAFKKLEKLAKNTKNKQVKEKIELIVSRKSSILRGLENTESSVFSEINNIVIDCMKFFPEK